MKDILLGDDLNTIGIHYSQLLRYISAYAITEEAVKQFKITLENTLKQVKEQRIPGYVDDDGEMFLTITPGGYIHLCIRYRTFKIDEAE